MAIVMEIICFTVGGRTLQEDSSKQSPWLPECPVMADWAVNQFMGCLPMPWPTISGRGFELGVVCRIITTAGIVTWFLSILSLFSGKPTLKPEFRSRIKDNWAWFTSGFTV